MRKSTDPGILASHLQSQPHLLWPALTGVIVAAIVMVLFFALSLGSIGRGGQDRVAAAYASGALTEEDYLPGDTVRGVHQYNDCVILGMALDQRYSRAELTLSPSNPFDTPTDACGQLKTGKAFTDRNFYHNYVHGHTMLARYLLPLIGVEGMRSLYRSMISILLAAGVGLCMLRLTKGRAQAAVFLVALLGFARFFGLESFGQSLSHGPSDLIIVAYVFWLSFRAGDLTRVQSMIGAAVFGALTMVFEFMTGGLPLGLAVVIGLTWFALRAPNVRDCIAAPAAFLSAAAAVMTIKYTAVAFMFGDHELLEIARQAMFRVDGTLPADREGWTAIGAIAGSFYALAPGLERMVGPIIALSIGFGLWALYRNRSPEIVLLAVSNVPIFGWFVVFQQHTIIHAWFMDRILVWTIISGLLMFGLTVRKPQSALPAS